MNSSHTISNAFFSPSIYTNVFLSLFLVFPCISFVKFHSTLLFSFAFSIISFSQFPFLLPRYTDVTLFWLSYFLFNNCCTLWGAFFFLALLHALFFILLSLIILLPFLSIQGAVSISSFSFLPIWIFFDYFKCFSCVTIMTAIIPLNDIGPLILLSKSSSSSFYSSSSSSILFP